MKASGTQRYQFSNSLVKWDKFGTTTSASIQKSHYSITFINWKNCEIPLEENETPAFNILVN